ncbi:MAG: methylenetetrahydrofolate dehydrogenase / methenyltetrahydrofolate cyclohydrolase [Actinomycetota bacterium]|jgi:methylenetetrahydrofolate dehydrogenase (NADP+)/methenyltetrahydrofolate cyclohydrolase|nr:methylenetetrahydrofolate dehydrogenase / methenyltetrahydrofolate cyclohydrolase [Actinomycetota bacterium]
MDGVTLRAEMIAAMRDEAPAAPAACLATVVVGDNPRCHAFARDKRSAATEAGIATVAVDLAAATTQDELDRAIAALAADDAGVHGIFVQLPLPDHLHLSPIPPAQDVDGAHPGSLHAPTTPAAVLRLLDRYGIALDGRLVVVVGGRHPRLADLLAARGADVTVLAEPAPGTCRPADILVAAAGRPHTITADHVGRGATVIDITGDLDLPAVATVAGAVAPYPLGVGPVAVACLLRHTLDAAR